MNFFRCELSLKKLYIWHKIWLCHLFFKIKNEQIFLIFIEMRCEKAKILLLVYKDWMKNTALSLSWIADALLKNSLPWLFSLNNSLYIYNSRLHASSLNLYIQATKFYSKMMSSQPRSSVMQHRTATEKREMPAAGAHSSHHAMLLWCVRRTYFIWFSQAMNYP